MEKTSFNSKIILFCVKLISAVLCSRGKSRPRWRNACLFIGRTEKVIQAGNTTFEFRSGKIETYSLRTS